MKDQEELQNKSDRVAIKFDHSNDQSYHTDSK